MPRADPEANRAYMREYDKRKRAEDLARPPARKPCERACGRLALPRRKLCSGCKLADYRAKNPEYFQSYQQKRRHDLKVEVVTLYGGGCNCSRCPETGLAFMTIDHTKNDGGGRKRKNNAGVWADAKQRFGDGYYAVLCFNCNAGRHINGGTCPHES